MERAKRSLRAPESRKGRVTLAVVTGAVLLLSSGAVVLAQVTSETAEPAATGAPSDKAAAAAADLKAENARLTAAATAFASDLAQAPGSIHEYLVSLAKPVPATLVLAETELGLTSIYTWMLAPGSLYPKTGYWDLSTFAAGASPGDITAQITVEVQTYLDDRSKQIETLVASGDLTEASARTQLAEVTQLRAQLSNGVQIYGFRCTCSPQSLDALAARGDIISLRAVEDLREAGGSEPVWPSNPLRDQLLD